MKLTHFFYCHNVLQTYMKREMRFSNTVFSIYYYYTDWYNIDIILAQWCRNISVSRHSRGHHAAFLHCLHSQKVWWQLLLDSARASWALDSSDGDCAWTFTLQVYRKVKKFWENNNLFSQNFLTFPHTLDCENSFQVFNRY